MISDHVLEVVVGFLMLLSLRHTGQKKIHIRLNAQKDALFRQKSATKIADSFEFHLPAVVILSELRAE